MTGRTRALQVEVLRPLGSLSDLSDIVAVAGHHAPVGQDLPSDIKLYASREFFADGHHAVGLTRDPRIVERIALAEAEEAECRREAAY